MLHTLALFTIGLAGFGVFAAVVRDVPILNAFNRPDTRVGRMAAYIVGGVFAASVLLYYLDVTLGSVVPLELTWPIALIYFAYCLDWNLRSHDSIKPHITMTSRERQLLEIRMLEIETELEEIANLRVVGDEDGDPAAAEDDLLRQQDEIEYRLGMDYFERRDAAMKERMWE
jgi:hypothetical protein